MKNGIEIRPNGVKITRIGTGLGTGYKVEEAFPFHYLDNARRYADSLKPVTNQENKNEPRPDKKTQ